MLLTNVELGLGCPELQWLLRRREELSPPDVQPGFCLYLSTSLPLGALGKGEAQGVHCHTALGPQLHSGWPRTARSREPHSLCPPPWLCPREGVKHLPCDSKH